MKIFFRIFCLFLCLIQSYGLNAMDDLPADAEVQRLVAQWIGAGVRVPMRRTNSVDEAGRNNLHHAALHNNCESVSRLLATRMYDVNEMASNFAVPLSHAIFHGNGRMIDELIAHGADPLHARALDCFNQRGDNELLIAALRSRKEYLKRTVVMPVFHTLLTQRSKMWRMQEKENSEPQHDVFADFPNEMLYEIASAHCPELKIVEEHIEHLRK